MLLSVVDNVIDDVVNSTHRQPSIPGIVCEVITEFIRSDSLTVNKEDVKRPKESKKQIAESSKKKVYYYLISCREKELVRLVSLVYIIEFITLVNQICYSYTFFFWGGRETLSV